MADTTRKKKKKTNIAVWFVLGLLILALGGFGAGQFGGSLSSVAEVGDREITVNDYANALQNERQRLAQQTGQPITLAQMQSVGLDRQVMERLLAAAALDHEAGRMGISVGDAEVAERIRNNPSFGGVTGTFDREGYAFALRNAGLTEARFEGRVRDEAARELLQAAVVGGVGVPDTYVDAVAGWLAETRDATLAEVGIDMLPTGNAAPGEGDLAAFYAENGAAFEVPETRRITYAWITPDRLSTEMEVDEDRLRTRYEEMGSEFRQPARVLAERLAFPDADAATAARAAIEAGETTFDALVEERGLTLDDVDQGEIAATDVAGPVAEALFALTEPGIAGPVDTTLGPVLYRVNAVLDATEVPFEEVREDLSAELAADAARRAIDSARDDIDDLLAGGATLEELVAETDMELGEIALRPDISDGIAGYEEFREAALAAQDGDFPELGSLADGGLFALRLDGIDPAAIPPLKSVRDAVEEAWRSDATARRLAET
ncbi:MAG: peptidylprolyl isomerase, partial [Jannaschia sp.]